MKKKVEDDVNLGLARKRKNFFFIDWTKNPKPIHTFSFSSSSITNEPSSSLSVPLLLFFFKFFFYYYPDNRKIPFLFLQYSFYFSQRRQLSISQAATLALILSDSSLKPSSRFYTLENIFGTQLTRFGISRQQVMCRRLHQSMDVEERRISSGYAKPPWIFKGSALYQIHLVKASTARAFVPKEFRLVEAFGYTLGGFFLASYDDSPAGVFDELVVIAGIVWNPPTSCAWAARVLVNSDEACHHGRKEVGLPSQVARFSKKIIAVPKPKRNRAFSFLDTFGLGTTLSHSEDLVEVKVSEVDGAASADICNIQIRLDETKVGNWMGPAIKMALPSFSGNTKYNSNLLKYSCHLHCRVRPVRPAVVSGALEDETENLLERNQTSPENERRLSVAVMLSKPIIALQFKCLTMQVEAPVVIYPSK